MATNKDGSFSTEDILPRERNDFWQQAVSAGLLPLRTEPLKGHKSDHFRGIGRHYKIGPFAFTHLKATAQNVIRDYSDISQKSAELYYLCLQISGTVVVKQGNRKAEQISKPGSFEIVDGCLPGRLYFPENYERLILTIPRKELYPHLSNPDWNVGRVIHPGDPGCRATSLVLKAFAFTSETFSEHDGEEVGTIIINKLLEALNKTTPHEEGAFTTRGDAYYIAANSFIDRNLTVDTLNPQMVADSLDISKSRLQQVFMKKETSVMHTVLMKRLAQCRTALADPKNRNKTIIDIATAWGFNNESHFGKTFRERYGETPSAYRKRALK